MTAKEELVKKLCESAETAHLYIIKAMGWMSTSLPYLDEEKPGAYRALTNAVDRAREATHWLEDLIKIANADTTEDSTKVN